MAPPDFAGYVGRSRSHSISSDRTSLTGFGSLLSPPKEVTPDPAFIAASAASQIVTNDHDSLADTWFDQHGIEPSGETALVAPAALKLVNRFLDQLLFNFLSISKSTSLGALRPAVSEVLKPKLAKGAINGAEQELHEYLGGGEDEDLLAFHDGLEPSNDWDLELVWKRTRLRCMVYSSLGDMEEEDEDYYTEQEQLDGPPGSNSNRFSNNPGPGIVSPAVAIFLTSILEYMGEQVLIVAGQAAYHRLRSKHERAEREGTNTPSEIADRVVVEEADMERVALDRTLGRLWRGWKKRIRSPTNSISMTRSFSRESLTSPLQVSRATSMTPEEIISEDVTSLATVLAEYEQASFIPLPMTDDDVREIEIPGLAKQIDDEEEKDPSADEELPMKLRPKSMLAAKSTEPSEAASTLSPSSKQRRNSLPHPAKAPYSSPPIAEVPSGEDGEAEDVEEKELVESVTTEKGSNEPEVAKEEKATSNDHKGLDAGVIATAAAVSAATVAGVVAVAKGEAPQTALESSKEETDTEDDVTEEDVTEEAQIMTSSRVSIGGMTPDELKDLSRQSSVRSPSVHSLRLIDVTSAKNSTGRSRNDSVDAADYISNGRARASSRPGSINSPVLDTHTPRIVSPIARGASSSPVIRNGSSLSARQSARDSIVELEEMEVHEAESEPKTAVPADIARPLRGSDVDPSLTSSQFTADGSRGATPQNSTFVLSAPPAARSLRDAPTSHPSEDIMQQSSTPATARTPGVDSGVPPLTPLREMMEGAADTSDEASSVAPSNDAHSMSERGVRGHVSSDSTSTISKSRRVPEQERSIQPQIINPLRSSPPRASRDEAARKNATEPKSQRSLHTSGSGSSSNSHKIKPVRTSQESTSTVAEDKGRSFEQLIRSDQTIQYTLTPQNMRNIEGPESAVATNVNDVQRPKTSRSHSSSVSKRTGSQSQPAVETPKAAEPFKAIPRPTSNAGSRLRANTPQPRDARVDRDSIGDFADFIRSTGPVESYERVPPRSAPGHRGANGVARNGSASSPRSAATSSSTLRRTESAAGRSKLQARDAVVTRGDSISDLIDFVRSGPQLSKEDHRIPRTVAPFRTTMDSDQMSGAIGGRAIDASLPDPRTSQASTSAHNSVNSQSALLTNASKNKSLPVQSQNNFEQEEDMMPKRKTRRVRDPYAIDFSDDEEEYEAAPKPRATQEESLADFLKNVPPPPDSTVTPIYVPDKNVKKKSSKSQLMSRFGRNGSGPQSPPKPDITSQAARTQQPRQLYTPIAAKYSTTMNFNQTSPPSSSYVSQLDTARNTTRTTRNVSQIPSRPKVAHKSYQPREAVSSSSRTSDLADFLKRSEPPSSVQTQPQTSAPTLQKEEASAFQRMFGRKKVA